MKKARLSRPIIADPSPLVSGALRPQGPRRGRALHGGVGAHLQPQDRGPDESLDHRHAWNQQGDDQTDSARLGSHAAIQESDQPEHGLGVKRVRTDLQGHDDDDAQDRIDVAGRYERGEAIITLGGSVSGRRVGPDLPTKDRRGCNR